MAKVKDYKQPSRAELQAMRETKLQGAPASEAVRREISFLRNVGGAGDDLEWILFNQAWTELGFENVGDWWEQRVLPVLVNVDMRPSPALADRVMAAIAADEAGLPKLQRRTQRQIAALARTSQARVSRSRSDANESGRDLEKPAEGSGSALVDAFRTEIESVEDKQKSNNETAAAVSRPADGGGREPTSPPPAAGPGAQTRVGEADRPGPAVTPEQDFTDEEAVERSEAAASSTPPGAGVSQDGGDESGPEEPSLQLPSGPDSAQAAVPQIPVWFGKVQAVVKAVNDLIDEDPGVVGAEIPLNWATAVGDSANGLAEWYGDMRDAITEAAEAHPE